MMMMMPCGRAMAHAVTSAYCMILCMAGRGLAPKSDNEVMCWLEIKQNPGRAGLEAQGRAGLRRRPCEARKFRVFETQITQICLPFEGTHVDPRHVQTHRKRVLNKGIMKTPAK